MSDDTSSEYWAEAASLHARVRAHLAQADLSLPIHPTFDELALEVARFQLRYNLPYRRFAALKGLTPERLTHWLQAPPVPTDVFKAVTLQTFPPERTVRTFLTSGTTQSKRGQHAFCSLELYDAAIEGPFRRFVLPDLPPSGKLPFLALVHTAAERPESSLSYMVERLMPVVGGEGSAYFMRADRLESHALASALETLAATGQPVLLMGTAFAFVYLCDDLPHWNLKLPKGSRLVETGGLKGRVREISREALYALLQERLGLPKHAILAEYGMTELSSQLYDRCLRDHHLGVAPLRRLVPPPWLQVLVVDPVTLEPLPFGKRGLIRFFDLANLYSVAAVQTSDLGIWTDEGLTLLGRVPGAEARGCSLTIEELRHVEASGWQR